MKIISYICLALMAALTVFIAVALLIRWAKLKKAETVTVKASISDMHQTDMSVIKSVSLDDDRYVNVIEFDLGDRKIDLKVSKWVYGAVKIGDTGVLTYKDNVFISFDPADDVE
ncbi:MAG: DUF2500 domain-containing protein [Ruminococcaceae bacterium]|nr:DUF2500 domain-containing protein [Oscillospiraceae bacterium]